MAKTPIAILLSGRGSNMMALVEAASAPDCPYAVVLIASDKPDAAGLAWAADRGLPTWALSPQGIGKSAYEAALDARLREAGAEIVALAGYMRLLSSVLIETSGGASPIRCHGHRKHDAVEMKRLIEQYQDAYYRDPANQAARPAASGGADR